MRPGNAVGSSRRTTPEAWMDYLAERDDLIAIRNDTIAITRYVIDGLVELGQAGPSSYGLRKAAMLQELVLEPLQRRQYAAAQSGLYEFLNDDLMLQIMERLINHASPGIDLLVRLADEYDI